MHWIDAEEAVRILGVHRRTLYTYASRGWIGTRPLDGRRKLYRKADVERLRERASAHQGRSARAAQAVRWGEPILETAISGIDRDGPYYRGVPAVDLVDRPLQEVAELLWGFPAPWTDLPTCAPVADLVELRRQVDALPREGPVPVQAVRITRAVQALAGIPSHPDLHAATVLLADHGLTPSTFTARVVASTGADLFGVVVAALAALAGPRHGLASSELAGLLADPVAFRARLPGGLPGFGHPLYPDGDPRALALLERTGIPESFRWAFDEAAGAGQLPNIDAALVVLCHQHDLPVQAASRLFAAGRVMGWLAHALEQADSEEVLRPRGRFAGWT